MRLKSRMMRKPRRVLASLSARITRKLLEPSAEALTTCASKSTTVSTTESETMTKSKMFHT